MAAPGWGPAHYHPAHDLTGCRPSREHRGTDNPRADRGRVYRLSQLANVPVAELKKLHGVGPKALRLLQEALKEQGMWLG